MDRIDSTARFRTHLVSLLAAMLAFGCSVEDHRLGGTAEGDGATHTATGGSPGTTQDSSSNTTGSTGLETADGIPMSGVPSAVGGASGAAAGDGGPTASGGVVTFAVGGAVSSTDGPPLA